MLFVLTSTCSILTLMGTDVTAIAGLNTLAIHISMKRPELLKAL